VKEIIPFLQEDVDGLVATYLDSVLHKLITASLRLIKIAVELQDFSTHCILEVWEEEQWQSL
jgi:hypothetical protein